MNFMDYMAHYEVSPRLRSQGLHAHDFYEFYFHVKGGHFYCVDDTVFELKPNQLIIIPPLHMHGLVCDRDLVDYERCWLYLSPETLSRFGFGKIDLIKRIDEICAAGNFINLISENESKIIIENLKQLETETGGEQLFAGLSYNVSKKEINSTSVSLLSDYLKILENLEIAFRAVDKASDSTSAKSEILLPQNSSSAMQKVLHYINNNYTQNISIEDLCSRFNMSESSLSHEFRKYTNKGVYEYILYKRIIRAKELLFTDLNLTQISLECGFNDYSNFLRVFKKITGKSPKEYKKDFSTV